MIESECNSVSLYFKDIEKINHLKREEEYELARRIREGDEDALNTLIKSNLKFVVSMAKEYTKYGVPIADLISEGNIGLITAAKKYDESKGVKFISYAVWWLRNSFNECVERYKKKKVSSEETNTYSMEEYREYADKINASFEEDVVDALNNRSAIETLMTCLNEREVKVLTLYFGLYGEKEMNLNEISDVINVSAERTRQILHMSLDKLRVSALCSKEFENLKNLC